MAQTYEIDINRYNGTDYDTLLPTPATHASTHKADGVDPLTCQTGNYGDKTVTRAKLADEVLVTPIVNIGATYTATRTDTGKLIRMKDGTVDYVINFIKNVDIPIGATYPIFKNWVKSNKIVFSDKCMVAVKGEETYLLAPTFTITDTFTLVAVQKIAVDPDYDYWYISGDVEVVT